MKGNRIMIAAELKENGKVNPPIPYSNDPVLYPSRFPSIDPDVKLLVGFCPYLFKINIIE